MQTIGRYVVEGEAGRGSSGIVYRARDPLIGRVVAIKQICFDTVPTPEERQRLRERLFREAQSAGQLSHPGIVTIYDIQEQQGSFANIFMEYVEGETLEQILRKRTLSPEETRSILEQTAAALDFAHQKGVVHRDVKPANLMVTPNGAVKIADFGIARMQSQNATLHNGALLGTPTYMAPEQIQAKPAGARADQFSLGVVAYEMLTGHTPYRADSIPTLLYQVVSETPPSARRSNPSLTIAIESALNRVLAKDPIARFESCTAFVNALSGDWKTVAHEPELTLPTMAFAPVVDKPPAEPPPFVRQHAPARASSRFSGLGMILAMAAVVGLTVGAFTYFRNQSSASRQTVTLPPAEEKAAAPQEEIKPPPIAEKPKEEVPPPEARKPTVVQPFDGNEPASRPQPRTTDSLGTAEYAIKIRTVPAGARIVVDGGSPTCTSPCSVPLAPGRHTLAINAPGYLSAFRILQVPDQTEVNATLEAATGKLSLVTTPPGAEIRVDGALRAERTPTVLTLPVGKHRITITLPGNDPKERDIEITEGAIAEFRVSW